MNHFDTLITRYPALSVCADDIQKAENMMLKAYYAGGKILACGNGGSASDAAHIVGELMKGFLLKRPMNEETKKKFESVLGEEAEVFAKNLQCGIPAIALDSQHALFTAYANDVDADYVYAQQVFGYARENDLFIGISTSGNSSNIIKAYEVAKHKGIHIISLTGNTGGKMKEYSDILLNVPSVDTPRIQESHIMIGHIICEMVEANMFPK
jgi:D-sedoheptulose 7-phosphate isomerase